jgi:GNAT superfamily N-acetyltransferase
VPEVVFRKARPEDEPLLQAIRRAAFAPIFASFREILGDEVYEIAQRREDEAQEVLLASLLARGSAWELYVVEAGGHAVGFVSLQLNDETKIGEVGLNAVDPAHAGTGIGTRMYEFAATRMSQAGMKVATVATGGDAGHAPARRAYQKAGFDRVIPSVWMVRKL